MSMNAIARTLIDAVNLRAVAIDPSFVSAMANDIQTLATADPEKEKAAALAARVDLLAAYGLPGFHCLDEKPFAFSEGIAIIPVTGMLINRCGYSWGSYVTGYNFIRSQIRAAAADPDVTLIVMDVNSYGGQVAGCFELSADIRLLRDNKPIVAVVDSNCMSAAYAVASAAHKIIVTPSGRAGSIGVVATHISYQGLLEKEGVKFTLIASGEHKTDANPYEDLSASVKADIKTDVDKGRQKFAELVALNRGMKVDDILATEAQVYSAEDALSAGLIDLIAPPDQAVESYLSKREDSSSDEMETATMTIADQSAAASQGTVQTNAAAPVDTSAADARKAERARIQAIKALPEAEGKSRMADHLALNTDLSVDDAKGILSAAAAETAVTQVAAATAPVDTFAQAMDNSPNPNVGVDGGEQQQAKVNPLLAGYSAATGHKFD